MKINVDTVSKGLAGIVVAIFVALFIAGLYGLVSYGLAFVISYFSGRPLDNQLWFVCFVLVLVVKWVFTRVSIRKE